MKVGTKLATDTEEGEAQDWWRWGTKLANDALLDTAALAKAVKAEKSLQIHAGQLTHTRTLTQLGAGPHMASIVVKM